MARACQSKRPLFMPRLARTGSPLTCLGGTAFAVTRRRLADKAADGLFDLAAQQRVELVAQPRELRRGRESWLARMPGRYVDGRLDLGRPGGHHDDAVGQKH